MDEKNVKELTEKAEAEQYNEPENVTHADDKSFEPIEDNQQESHEQTEGDVVPSEDLKEEWSEDIKNNDQVHQNQATQQEGSGAFEAARSAWANGGWPGM